MKKILLMLCSIVICGCSNNWKKNFDASEIKIETIESLSDVTTYVSGKIKNISNKTCDLLEVTIEFKSGTLITEETIDIIAIDFNPNEIIEYDEAINHKNYENYNPKFKNIICH